MYGIADKGATKNYIKVQIPCTNKFQIFRGTHVLLPDGIIIQDTHK